MNNYSTNENELFTQVDKPFFKFLGRQWVFDKLNKHFNGFIKCPNTFLFLGSDSTGKTKLLKQISQTSYFKNQTLFYYECNELSNDINFVLNAVKQLKKKIPYIKIPNLDELEIYKKQENYNLILKDEIDKEDLKFFETHKTKPDKNIFWNFILFPIIEHGLNRWEDKHFFIIIDSIDSNIEILDLLTKNKTFFPNFLFLIISAKPKKQLKLSSRFLGSRKFFIDDLRKKNVLNDLKLYTYYQLDRLNIKNFINENNINYLVNQLSIKSNGCYIYIKLYVDYIKKNIFELNTNFNIGSTLNGLYSEVFNKLFEKDKKTQQIYKTILCLIISSKKNEIKKTVLSKFFLNSNILDNVLNELEFFQLINIRTDISDQVIIKLIDGPLKQWLSDLKLSSYNYYVNKNFGHVLLVNRQFDLPINELCYQIDNSSFNSFNLDHKIIWFLLHSNYKQYSNLNTQIDSSEIAKKILAYKKLLFDKFNDSFLNNYLIVPTVSQLDENTNLFIEITSKKKIPFSFFKNHTKKIFQSFLNCIEPEEEKNFQIDFDSTSLLKVIENSDIQNLRHILNINSELVNKCFDGMNPLFYAITTENKKIVEVLIEYDADVNQIYGDDNQTPLMLAAQLNLYDICELLLENDAEIDAKNQSGKSAIVYGIIYKAKPCLIEIFLNWGAKTDYLDEDGRSLLSIACINLDVNLETIRLLIAGGIDEFHCDRFGKCSLHFAAIHGKYEVIKFLVEIGGEKLICMQDNEGKMPIHYAVSYGCDSILPLLCCSSNINQLSNFGRSPLRIAALEKQYECLHILIECGADINAVDLKKRSTLFYLASISSDNLEILNMIKELIKLNANLEICDLDERTALHVSCWRGYEKTVALLLSAGAEVNAVDNARRSSLHLCAWTNNIKIMKKLIEHGAKIDACTNQGATPLLIAVQQGKFEACKILIENGANVFHKDKFGQNIENLLISSNQNIELIKLFEKFFGKISLNETNNEIMNKELLKNNSCSISFDFEDTTFPLTNSNISTEISLKISKEKSFEDENTSTQGEGRSWMDSSDNLASFGDSQNLCISPFPSSLNISNIENTKYNSNNQMNLNQNLFNKSKLLAPSKTNQNFLLASNQKKKNPFIKMETIGNKISKFLS